VVYRKDSERTCYRHRKYWREASQGCANIESFFALKLSQLMARSEMRVHLNNMILQPNPVEEMAVDLGLDVLDFCIDQLEDNDNYAVTMSDMEVDENEFEVSKDKDNTRIKLTDLLETDCRNQRGACKDRTS
jgi:hypothetical protein